MRKKIIILAIFYFFFQFAIIEIYANTTLKVGIYDYKPFTYKEADGNVKGIYGDILGYIANEEGWEIEYIEGSWIECLEWLKNNKIDLLVAISYTAERGKHYDFSHEPIITNRGQIFKKKGLKIDSIIDLNDKKIALYNKGIFAETFKKLAQDLKINCQFIEVEDYTEVFKLIEEGVVDAGVSNNIYWIHHQHNYKIDETPIIFTPAELLFAAPKNKYAAYLDKIDQHIVNLKLDKNSIYHQAINKWTIDKWALLASEKRLPRWIKYVLLSAGVLASLFFITSLVLKHQVKKKTFEIVERNRQLNREIIERENTSKALQEQERMLATFMGNLPGIAYRLINDEHWTIDFISTGCNKLLGYSTSYFNENKTKSFRQIIHPDDYQDVVRKIKTAVAVKESYQTIYRMKTHSNQYKWICDQGTGLFADDDTLTALEGFISNITQQQESELQLRKENIYLRSSIKDRFRFGNIIGKSPAMQEVYELILKAGTTSDNVNIYGESGTGKELVARAIHDMSDRSQGKFVTVNCGAIPENLIESEFFGFKKGAFTGAEYDKKGLLDIADGGTLFLDEIGNIDLNTQVKLLRAIEGGGYTPIGGTRIKYADLRIISACNEPLNELLTKGLLREDFFYRIHVISVFLPPLRNRKEDIPLLVEYFLRQHDKEKRPPITGNIIEAFLGYEWPGNVRELQNVLNRYIALGTIDFLESVQSDPVTLAPHKISIFSGTADRVQNPMCLKDAVNMFEKRYIAQILNQHNWHRGRVSKVLNIHRKTLFKKIKAHHLSEPNASKK